MTKMRALMPVIAIILITTGNAACTRYVYPPLPLPTRPKLLPVSEAELRCLGAETYQRLLARERKRREYAEDLETIIKSTQASEKP